TACSIQCGIGRLAAPTATAGGGTAEARACNITSASSASGQVQPRIQRWVTLTSLRTVNKHRSDVLTTVLSLGEPFADPDIAVRGRATCLARTSEARMMPRVRALQLSILLSL